MKINIDTIAAIATPAGDGGLAVLRVSGTAARDIVGKIFHGVADIEQCASHTAHVGRLIDGSGETLDSVVCTVFKGPRSYTGEDTVEISCHGGHLVARRILELLITSGARAAAPGEFTKRAFLNGRIDLAQAEAVADLIEAQSDAGRRASVRQLEGGLSEKLRTVRARLLDVLGPLELELDFAEDGYEFVGKATMEKLLEELADELAELIHSYSIGRVFRDGIRVALVGAPNAGKSSLLNALLRESRAIVTSIPGTTRDVIVENITVDGILFQIADTAGIRETNDPIETEGVRRALDEMENADVMIWVADLTRDADDQLKEMGSWAKGALMAHGSKAIVAQNKADLVQDQKGGPLTIKSLSVELQAERVSALTGKGIRELEQLLVAASIEKTPPASKEGVVITNSRHHTALSRCREALLSALSASRRGATSEFLALDVRAAMEAIGEVTGEVTTDEILESIFSRFCIGK